MEEKCTVMFKEIVDIAAAKSAAHATSSSNQCFIKKESELHYAKAGFKKNGKERSHGISSVPVKEHAPFPFAIKERVEKELERLESLGVIEPVDYSPWGTPVVPVLKKDGSVRLCGDFKVTLNLYIEIDQHPLPRVEELFAKLQVGESNDFDT
nr:uncharacterized protein K02A2.6-like [Leptinotarsa decemlineata]